MNKYELMKTTKQIPNIIFKANFKTVQDNSKQRTNINCLSPILSTYKYFSDRLLELHGCVGEGGRYNEGVSGGVDHADQHGGHYEAPAGRKKLQETKRF